MKFYILALAATVPFLTQCGKKKVESSTPAPIIRTVIDENYDYLQGGWQQVMGWKYPEFTFRGRSFKIVTQQKFDPTTKVIEATVYEGDFEISGTQIIFDVTRSSCPDDVREKLTLPYQIDRGGDDNILVLRDADVFLRTVEPDLQGEGMELRTGCRNTVGTFTAHPVGEVQPDKKGINH